MLKSLLRGKILGKEGEPICLKRVYEALGEKFIDEHDETRGDINGIYVGMARVTGLEPSKEIEIGDYVMKKAVVCCACGNCDGISRAIIVHLSREIKEGHEYRMEGTPKINADGTLEIANYF